MRTFLIPLLLTAALVAGCQSLPPRIPPSAVSPDVDLGSVRVDSAQRVVVATGFVNQVVGPIELFLCGPGGKRHESIFVMESDPLQLQAALLLVGCKAGPVMEGLGMGPPLGTRVELWIAPTGAAPGDGRPSGEYILRVKDRKDMGTVPWVFTGSMIKDGQFKALAEESYVATWWDPWAILNLDHPLGADDESFIVNTNAALELHSPVTFYFRPIP